MRTINTTENYFGLPKEELLKVVNGAGYTREECKILDDGLKINFYENMDSFNDMEGEDITYYAETYNYEVKQVLEMASGRIAIVFN